MFGNVLLNISDALHDLVPFVQFKKHGKHPWKSATFNKVAAEINTSQWVFLTFFKLYKWYLTVQSITYAAKRFLLLKCKVFTISYITGMNYHFSF